MRRFRIWIAGALGLAAGIVAFRWVEQDRPLPDERRPRRAAVPDAGVPDAGRPVDPAPPGGTRPIEVADGWSGTPLPDVQVTTTSHRGAADPPAAVTYRSASAATGAATIPAAPGRWTIEASHGGRPLGLVDGDDLTLGPSPPPVLPLRVVPLDRLPEPDADPVPRPPAGPHALVGTITQDGARVADVVATPYYLGTFGPGRTVVRDRVPRPVALPPRRYAGTEGQLRYDGLVEGGWAVLLVAPGRGAALAHATITGGLAGDVSIELAAPAVVAGTVTDQRGGTVAGAAVRLSSNGVPIAAVSADAGGRFVVRELPDVRIELVASAPGCYSDRVQATLVAGERAVLAPSLHCEGADPIRTPVPEE